MNQGTDVAWHLFGSEYLTSQKTMGSVGLCMMRKYFLILSTECDQQHSKGSSLDSLLR